MDPVFRVLPWFFPLVHTISLRAKLEYYVFGKPWVSFYLENTWEN